MINIHMTDRRFSLDKRKIRSLANEVLRGEKTAADMLNIIFCNDRQITELNRRFLKKNYATDVISFNLGNSANGSLEGEVYINLQQARRQARDNKIKYKEEVERLTLHGILHLVGYDDQRKKDRHRMWERQESYLKEWKK